MPEALAPYCEDLESRIDAAIETDLETRWKAFASGRHDTPLFSPRRPAPKPPRIAWPAPQMNAALDDPEVMMLAQLLGCSKLLEQGSGGVLNIRANYGTCIVPAIFSCDLFRMPDETNTLPTNHPVPGGEDAIRRLIDAGTPSMDHPYVQQVFDFARRFVDLRTTYPKIARHVNLYHPDLQGPMDILELVWGSEFFMALMDSPELVHAFLRLIVETYTAIMQRWQEIVPPPADNYSVHWGLLYRGQLMLRDDSAMNLSAEMFAEFVLPYDRQLLEKFGGGVIHACGHVDHFVRCFSDLPQLHGFNLTQPHLNDMERIYRQTLDRGIPLLGLPRQAAEEALRQERANLHLIHVA